MFDDRPLERLENDAAFFQVFRNDIALDQLVVRENHASSEPVYAARIFQNVFTVAFGK
jgi:hypothetical protein